MSNLRSGGFGRRWSSFSASAPRSLGSMLRSSVARRAPRLPPRSDSAWTTSGSWRPRSRRRGSGPPRRKRWSACSRTASERRRGWGSTVEARARVWARRRDVKRRRARKMELLAGDVSAAHGADGRRAEGVAGVGRLDVAGRPRATFRTLNFSRERRGPAARAAAEKAFTKARRQARGVAGLGGRWASRSCLPGHGVEPAPEARLGVGPRSRGLSRAAALRLRRAGESYCRFFSWRLVFWTP